MDRDDPAFKGQRDDQVDLEVVGSVALFAAANSRSSPGSRDQTGLKASNG
jgi:hypothetical protein